MLVELRRAEVQSLDLRIFHIIDDIIVLFQQMFYNTPDCGYLMQPQNAKRFLEEEKPVADTY